MAKRDHASMAAELDSDNPGSLEEQSAGNHASKKAKKSAAARKDDTGVADKANARAQKMQEFKKQPFNSPGNDFLSTHDERSTKSQDFEMIGPSEADWEHARSRPDKDAASKKPDRKQERWRRVDRCTKEMLDYYAAHRLGLDVKKLKDSGEWNPKNCRVRTVLEREEYLFRIENGYDSSKENDRRWQRLSLEDTNAQDLGIASGDEDDEGEDDTGQRLSLNPTRNRERTIAGRGSSDDGNDDSDSSDMEKSGGATTTKPIGKPPRAPRKTPARISTVDSFFKASSASSPSHSKSARTSPVRTSRKRIGQHEPSSEAIQSGNSARDKFVKQFQELAKEQAEIFYDITQHDEDIHKLQRDAVNRNRENEENDRVKRKYELGKYTLALLEGKTFQDVMQAKKNQGKVGWWSRKGSRKSCRKRGLPDDGTRIERFFRLVRYELTALNYNNATFTSGDVLASLIQGLLFQFREENDRLRKELESISSSALTAADQAKEETHDERLARTEHDSHADTHNTALGCENATDRIANQSKTVGDDQITIADQDIQVVESDTDSECPSNSEDDEDSDDEYWPQQDWWKVRGYSRDEANELKFTLRRSSVDSELEVKSKSSESKSHDILSPTWAWTCWQDSATGAQRREPAPIDADERLQHIKQRDLFYAQLRDDNSELREAELHRKNTMKPRA